jgi:ubiquinone/menaquinone biosynthesis C-methylase UbiE
MDQNNKYTQMQRHQYDSTADIMAIENHRGHDSNPDYYGLLLKDVTDNPEIWKDKVALDFGCGIGRNVDNLLRKASWSSAEGCDISSENIIRAEKFLTQHHSNFKLYTTTGITLEPVPSDSYDFVMSTIVLQHIAVHDIRTSLLKDIYRVMKPGALFSFQMAQYQNINHARYHENAWEASATNGAYDVSVTNPHDLVDDLTSFGFKNITYTIRPEWDANNKCYLDTPNCKWIYVKAYK